MAPATGSPMYRIRVDLDRSDPPIWRRLDLRADLALDVVHLALQAAFDWENRHLYRFVLGGGPFDAGSQHYLCDGDEELDEGSGRPASQVSLLEVLREPGDRLAYVYDFGDCWELTINLEQVRSELDDSPAATFVDGRRAAPPEDSRGMTLPADALPCDPDQINQALHGPLFAALAGGVDSRLIALISRLPDSGTFHRLVEALPQLTTAPDHLDDNAVVANFSAHRWFLNRAADAGIPLTSAGYMKPADVTAASGLVPEMADWIGKNNREANCIPLLDFRQSLQTLGLLRKFKGTLTLTRAGIAAQHDPTTLWRHVAAKLNPADNDTFESHATLLLLAQAGRTEDGLLRFDESPGH